MLSIKAKYDLAPKLSTITWKSRCIKYCRRTVKVKRTNSTIGLNKIRIKFEFYKVRIWNKNEFNIPNLNGTVSMINQTSGSINKSKECHKKQRDSYRKFNIKISSIKQLDFLETARPVLSSMWSQQRLLSFRALTRYHITSQNLHHMQQSDSSAVRQRLSTLMT